MPHEEQDRVREVFLAACEKSPEERPAFLKRACGRDESLRREVESLLSCDNRDDSFLRTPILAGQSGGKPGTAQDSAVHDQADQTEVMGHRRPAPLSEALPERIGHYRIVDILGEGGMGIVYRAEQESPRRTVALKVIKPGAESRELLKRFSHESQVLGWLQHPGIAQVFEAGTADTGRGVQPFFAMEFIDGRPLHDYVRTTACDMQVRLEIFAKICDAVHHAHQKGVIHRDLKPGNILVDRSGQPKILDFGVARVTDADVRTTTLQTDAGKLIGTIAYMSPEQIGGDTRELDTRSDVYALGVILYELLAGRLPHEVSHVTIPQAARIITDEDPASLTSVNRNFRGDVDTIVCKALEKDKIRRYQSALDLANDVRRFLADEPIAARPATTIYQLRKFAKRNKALVGGVLTTLVALLFGVVGISVLAVGISHERDRAREAEQRAEEQRAEAERQVQLTQSINDFLNDDLLAAVSPEEMGKDVRMRDVLDAAARNIEGKFKGEPVIEGSLRTTLGNTYKKLGVYDVADEQLERALKIAREGLGEEHPQTLKAMNNLAILYRLQGRVEEADPLLEEVHRVRLEQLGEEHPDSLVSMNNLANQYYDQRRFDEAEALYLKTLDIRRREFGDDHPDTLLLMNNLGALYDEWGKFDKAEPLYVAVLEARRRLFGPDHPDTLVSMNNLAVLYYNQKRYEEAEPLYIETVESRRRVLGEEHPRTLQSESNLAILWNELGRAAGSEALRKKTLEVQTRVLGEDHPDTLNTMNSLGVFYQSVGRFADAERLYTKVLERRLEWLGEENPSTQLSMSNLAVLLYNNMGRPREAEPWLLRLLEIRRRLLGESHPKTNETKRYLLGAYTRMGDWDKARPLIAEVFADNKARATGPNATPRAMNSYAWDLLTTPVHDLRDPASALEYAQRAVDGTQGRNAGILDTLALAQHMTGDHDAAAETARKAIALLPPGATVDRADFESSLAKYLIAGGRFAEAEPLVLAQYDRAVAENENDADRQRAATEKVADFYDTWHAADPGKGLEKKAASFRAQLTQDDVPDVKGMRAGAE